MDHREQILAPASGLVGHSVADSDLSIMGAGAVIQTLRKGGAVSEKIFSAFWALVWSKNKGGRVGPSPGSTTGTELTVSGLQFQHSASLI